MLGQHQYRVRIIGTYKGEPFTYEDPPDFKGSSCVHNDGGIIDPSSFWWSGGSMSCDCNRCGYVGESLDCGDEVKIDTIEPLDENWPRLMLSESDPTLSHCVSVTSLVMLGINEEFACGITEEYPSSNLFMDVKHEDGMKTAYVTVVTPSGIVHQCRVVDWVADNTEGILFVRGDWTISASSPYVR